MMSTMQKSHYGKMIMKYRGKWVALSPDEKKVVAAGKTLTELRRKIRNKQIKKAIYVMVSNKIGSFSF